MYLELLVKVVTLDVPTVEPLGRYSKTKGQESHSAKGSLLISTTANESIVD